MRTLSKIPCCRVQVDLQACNFQFPWKLSRSYRTEDFLCFSPHTESSPMSARNFPPSFWDSNYVPPTPPAITHPQMSDLYSTDSSLYSTEPWIHNAAHYGTYAAAQAHVYHQNMANMAQYGSQLGLLRLPQQYGGHSSRWVSWSAHLIRSSISIFSFSRSHRLHHEQTAHALESAYSNYSMPGECRKFLCDPMKTENSIKITRDALMSRLTCSLKVENLFCADSKSAT